MPFRHVVMFKFVEGLSADKINAIRNGLNSLPPQIEQIRRYAHGPDLGISADNFDYVLVADFDDVESWIAYRDNPIHKQYVADNVTGNLVGRCAVQYEI